MPGVTDKERDYLDIYMMMVGSWWSQWSILYQGRAPALVTCSTDNTAVAVQVMLHISLLDSRMGHIITYAWILYCWMGIVIYMITVA